MPKKVLIAVGDKTYTDILKETFKKHLNAFSLSSQDVFHRRFLAEIVEFEKPHILIVHDYYLASDFARPELKEQELLTLIRNWRMKNEEGLRIVFLCERPKRDPFLSMLVSLGVYDIFNSNSFDLDHFIEQLEGTPRFSKVEKFLTAAIPNIPTYVEVKEEKNEEEDKYSVKQERPIIQKVVEKKVVQKVVEKKVVQKVVNKNVIKKDYKIQITNNTERVIGVPIKKKLIMIGSSISRSGSTFISHLLARSLTHMGIATSYIENPFSRAYTYDRFAGHLSIHHYRSSFYQLVKGAEVNEDDIFHWRKGDVDLVCKNPTAEPIYKEDEVTFEHLIRILFSTQSTVTILDVGTDWQLELYQDVFDIANHAYFVLDPDVPAIQYFEESQSNSIQFLQKQLANEKIGLIGNRFEPALAKNGFFQDMFGKKLKTYVPAFSVNDIFQAQCQGIFLNDFKEYQKMIGPVLQPLISDILPPEFIKKQKKGPGLLKGLFNLQIKIENQESKGAGTFK